MIDSALFYTERLSNFEHRQSLLFQGPRARRGGFGCALPASNVDASFSSQGNAGSLTLRGVLQFDFGNAEQQAGDQLPYRAAEINLLRYRDHPYSTLAPVRQHVHAFLEAAGQTVKLPHDNGVNFSGEDRGLQFLERSPL